MYVHTYEHIYIYIWEISCLEDDMFLSIIKILDKWEFVKVEVTLHQYSIGQTEPDMFDIIS